MIEVNDLRWPQCMLYRLDGGLHLGHELFEPSREYLYMFFCPLIESLVPSGTHPKCLHQGPIFTSSRQVCTLTVNRQILHLVVVVAPPDISRDLTVKLIGLHLHLLDSKLADDGSASPLVLEYLQVATFKLENKNRLLMNLR